MKPKPSPLPDTCSIDMVQDGRLYQWPASGGERIPSVSDQPYSVVMHLDHVVAKLPSSYGYSEYEKYVVRDETDNDGIRGNESIEEFRNLDQLLARYDSFRDARIAFGDKMVHWLLVQRLQYDRLKAAIRIPETRYCFFSKRGLLYSSTLPGIIQKRVTGISLWDMINHEVVHADRERDPFVRQEYEPLVSHISSQLRPLATPAFSSHINWHIKNFIFDPETNVLYYLDLKPSSIFGRWRNEQNLRNIQRDFLR